MSQEQETITPAESKAAFDAGWNDDDNKPTETPAEVIEPEPTPEPTPAPQPEYVQVSKADWDAVQQKLSKVDGLDASFERVRDQVLGTMGRTLERRLAELQQATPQGAAVEISDEDFAPMKEQYPELADLTRTALNKALGKLKGTGGAQADAGAIDKVFGERLAQNRAEIGGETLDVVYPDWREDVAKPDFAKWLRERPGGEFMPLDKESRDKALGDPSSQLAQYVKAHPTSDVARACSTQARDAAAMLRSFYKTRDAAPAPTPAPTPAPGPAQPSMRQRQMAAAVATKGEGVTPPATKGKSAFQEGWESDD